MNDLAVHVPRLRRYARALTGDRFAADDLVQDTLERALSRPWLFRIGTRLDSWLLTIMHNIFVSQMRQPGNRSAVVPLDEQIEELPIAANESNGLLLRDLDRALARLPLEQREVLLLVGLEELSYEETAKILDIPPGTVMSRLSRARDRLRALLAGDDNAPVKLKVIK